MKASSFSDAHFENRFLSIDFFRGAVMFLLMAEATGLYELLVAPGLKGTLAYSVGLQFQHHPWIGLRLWDLGQPFFMFISGAAMWFSYNTRWERGERWAESLTHALTRSLLLLLLGWTVYLVSPAEVISRGAFLYDMLPQLAFASLIAFLMMRRPASHQLILAFGLIALSEFLFRIWAVPGFDQPFVPGHNFGSYVDHLVFGGVSEEHWVAFNSVPSAAFVMWGVLAGRLLRRASHEASKVRAIYVIGLGGVAAGLALSLFTPIIRRICSSSFVLIAGGACFLALSLVYWLVDVLRIRKGVLFFLPVGMNPLFIYLFAQTGGSDWLGRIGSPFSGGLFHGAGVWPAEIATSLATLGLMWGLCSWLYRRRIFIRI